MVDQAFLQAKPILEKLEAAGFKAFFVGGSVRDSLLGKKIGDIDITTSAQPEEVQLVFEKVIPVGIKHGTVIVRWEGTSFEVTTFRTEKTYSDYRHPDQVTFVTNVVEDLKRRDFTINAMAMDKYGSILDPFEGKKDLEKRMIKAVGNPQERFTEDPLRMMRALRFVSQLDFQLDQSTQEAIAEVYYLLERISVERIAIEVEKLFSGENPQNAVCLMNKTRLDQAVPVWKDNQMLFQKTMRPSVSFQSMEEIIAFYLLEGAATSLSQWVKAWKLSNRIKNNTETLIDAVELYKQHTISNWLVYKLPDSLHLHFFRLIRALFNQEIDREQWIKVYDKLPIKEKKELQINGKDIVSLFPEQQKGDWIKKILNEIEYQVVSGNLPNDKTLIKEWVINDKHPQTAD